MNILVANNSLKYLGGSETWSESLALALLAQGHHVFAYAPLLGEISDRLQRQGVECFQNMGTLSKACTPDIIIANHWPIVTALRNQYSCVPIISTIHGVLHRKPDGSHALEHPALQAKVSAFVAVSEEVQKKLFDDYQLSATIIRNGLDLEKFLAPAKIKSKPVKFLIHSNALKFNTLLMQNLIDVSKHFKGVLYGMGMHLGPCIQPWQEIGKVDVVFGLGRSVLEGVAMGKLGFVYGQWGVGGAICEASVMRLSASNFSGRSTNKKTWRTQEMIENIERCYTQENLLWGRGYIFEQHDAFKMAHQYVALAQRLIK